MKSFPTLSAQTTELCNPHVQYKLQIHCQTSYNFLRGIHL